MEKRPRWYVLDGHRPVPASMLEGARFLEDDTPRRVVGLTHVGDARVSTVFLCLDHGYEGEPVLFESMIFGGPLDGEQCRYHTWEEAEAGHAELVERAKAADETVARLLGGNEP